MTEHELNQYLDWQDKCYEEDKMNPKLSQKTADELIKNIDSMRTSPDYETRRTLFEHIRNHINSLVEQSEEEKCPICDTYKIEICGCNNHLLDY